MLDAILSGRLEFFGLPSLLQLVEAEAITGRLAIAGHAHLGLHGGRVVEADCGGFGGRTAALEAFLLGRGAFSLSRDEVAEGRPVGDTLELLMTGCRLADEWGRLAPLHLQPTDEMGDAGLGPLLPHLDAGPVRDAVRSAGLARSTSIDPLLKGIEEGWLREVARSSAPAPEALGSVDDLIGRARAATRARRLDEAEALLIAALALVPGDRIASQNLTRVRHLLAQGLA